MWPPVVAVPSPDDVDDVVKDSKAVVGPGVVQGRHDSTLARAHFNPKAAATGRFLKVDGAEVFKAAGKTTSLARNRGLMLKKKRQNAGAVITCL